MYLGVPIRRFGTVLVSQFAELGHFLAGNLQISSFFCIFAAKRTNDDGRDAIHGCDDAVADGNSTGGVAAPQDVA